LNGSKKFWVTDANPIGRFYGLGGPSGKRTRRRGILLKRRALRN